MKSQFKSLTDFAAEIERAEQVKNDYLVPGASLRMIDDNFLGIEGAEENLSINSYAHSQIASKFGIPKKYYDEMSKIPGLRTHNVNSWIGENPAQSHFVRTLDGKARAVLSNSYRPIDNFDVLSSFLPALQGLDVQVKSSALSETKMYLQMVFPKNEREVTVGDIVQQGLILTNSEVGAGAVDIKHVIWRLRCSNGMIGESVMRKYHIGSRLDSSQTEIYKNDTIKAELESFKLRLRDILEDAISETRFIEQVQKLQLAVEDKIPEVTKTVQNVTKRFGLSEKMNDRIIENMVNEGNLNRYGLANGLTFLAHSLEDPDRQYEVEKYGHQIIMMKRDEWGKFIAAS